MDIENSSYIRSIFIRNGEKLKFKIGQSISDDSYLSGSVYFIEEGSARVIYKKENKFKTIKKISKGACVGAISLIRSSACENIRASTELLAYKISDQDFKNFYQKDLKFKEFFDSNIFESEIIHFANHLSGKLINNQEGLLDLFSELKTSFQTLFCNAKEIIELIKTENRKIYLAQNLDGFEFYYLIDNQNKANNLFKDLDDKKKIRFISVDYDLSTQNNKDIESLNNSEKLIKTKGTIITDEKIPEFKKIKNIATNKNLNLFTLLDKKNNFQFLSHQYEGESQLLEIKYKNSIHKIKLNLIGKIQFKNILMAVIASIKSNISIEEIINVIPKIKSVEGRLERIGRIKNNSKVILDYAHTPDALKTCLKNIKEQFPGHKITLVFGCGGNRDQNKRAKMGKIADLYSDKIYLTDDNPRLEQPNKIRKDIKKGIKKQKVLEFSNRAKAISEAIKYLNTGEILLVAGKGHEKFQEIGMKKNFFSDKKIIFDAIKIKNLALSNNLKVNILNELSEEKKISSKISLKKVRINSREIKKDDVFFDVGSNWGWYSILVANQPQFCGKVHAFEPHPQNYSDLKSITQQCNFDKVVTCHNLALAEKPGVGKMAFSDGIQNGLARLGKFGVHVNLEMLDNLSLPKPQIIKIDAEDHELGVLLGAENIVKNCQPFIIIENWLHNDNPQKTLSPLKFLIDFDYNFFVLGWVSEDSNCIRLESSTYSELALVPFIIEQRFQLPNQLNIFAVPSQKIDELHTRLS